MTESKNPTAKPYKPIDTDVVDNLEHYALDRIHVRIQYLDHTSTQQELRGKIAEVFTTNHEEFLKMDDGRQMRLDQIIKVDADESSFHKKTAT